MKKLTILLLVSILVILSVFYWKRPLVEETIIRPAKALYKKAFRTGAQKKKIVIFTSPGGHGHQSATAALTEYLQNDYEIEPIYLIQDVLGSLDFVHTLTFGNFYSEQFYNYCLVKHHIWLVDMMVWCGLVVFKHKHETIKNLIEAYLIEQEPDMVISVIPVVNGAAAEVTAELGIPFWVIPTDLDPTMFLHRIMEPGSTQFFFNVPYKLPDLERYLSDSPIPMNHVTYAGFPVRTQFLAPHDRSALKQQHGIPADTPIVMLMMGGLGVSDTVNIAHEFAKMTTPAHCLICIGKNEQLRPQLETILQKSPTITYSILGFTPFVAPLMAMADLLITKSGGASINEALYMGLPMIIDGTASAPEWEYYNRSFIAEHGCGIVLKKLRKLSGTIDHLFQHPHELEAMKKAIQQIPRPNPELAMHARVVALLQ
jgi:processive 1,2-diacylglycerol beta-glucosyltransferase